MSYERTTIVGNINTTEVLKSGAGNIYVKMSVAVNRGTGDNRKTIWYSVLLFGKLAENPERIKALYAKGRLVLVEGRPQFDAYLKKDGTFGLEHTIIAITNPELLDSNKSH